jgi:hypothetical protein
MGGKLTAQSMLYVVERSWGYENIEWGGYMLSNDRTVDDDDDGDFDEPSSNVQM